MIQSLHNQNNDRALSLNLSIPFLERWLPRSQVCLSDDHPERSPTQHEIRLDGSLLDDGRLSYSLEQSLDDDNNHNSSQTPVTVHLIASVPGSSYGNDSSQYNYGVTGSVVMSVSSWRDALRNIWATLLRLSMLMGLLA
ncbi:fimbria/pilus outer membrane usher protein [Escherichia coli]